MPQAPVEAVQTERDLPAMRPAPGNPEPDDPSSSWPGAKPGEGSDEPGSRVVSAL